MFVLERRETQAAIRDQDEANIVVAGLERAGFKPLLRETLDSAYRAAGLVRPTPDMDLFVTERACYMRHSADPIPVGDLFFVGQQLFVLQPLQSKLRVWSVRPHTTESRLDEFCEATTKAATGGLDGRRLRGMTFAWQLMEAKTEGRNPFDRAPRGIEKLKSKKPEYSDEEARLAESLVDRDARTVLLQLAQARGKARSTDTKSEADARIIMTLHESQLIR
jgi:hypothetical protein